MNGRQLKQGATVALVITALAIVLFRPMPAQAVAFTVDSTADTPDANTADGVCDDGTGACTLRAAIQQANASPGADIIAFNIGEPWTPHTIHINSDLPNITETVTIDGYTQPGSSPSTNPPHEGTNAVVTVEIKGATPPPDGYLERRALYLDTGSENSVIRGLVMNTLQRALFAASSGSRIEGNFLGTDWTGTVARPNQESAFVHQNGVVGGLNPEDRNLISGSDIGVFTYLTSGTGNVIVGNLIGTDATGTQAIANNTGVWLHAGHDNMVGGTIPEARNIISGNIVGIEVEHDTAHDNVIIGNFIGTDASGSAPLPNTWMGVELDDWAPDNVIGGTAPGQANVIANTTGNGAGVFVHRGAGNTIRGNSITANAGAGIVLSSGGNNSLTAPVISSATSSSASGTACANCTIDVYSDPDDEGAIYHGSTMSDGSGNWSFASMITGPNVTATATNAGGDTSAFSAPFTVDSDADGYFDDLEAYLGTEPLVPCGFTPGGDPASETWPPDLAESNSINVSDVLALKPHFGGRVPPTPTRYDLVPSGGINVTDVLALKPPFAESCTP